MITVPAGKFLMGERQTQAELFLPVYQLGKYPLTNAEYGRFIEAGGYQRKDWWTEAGWAKKEEGNWSEPRYWQETRFNKPNQPVVGVSWYECMAYCRWLSAETGRLYRLPTEAEWEKGARGLEGWLYPWGNEAEASRLNIWEGEQVVSATTPVGIYPTGATPLGVFDCAGNVWEWCFTRWQKPYQAQEDTGGLDDLEGTAIRVLRGGSWYARLNYARCAFRSRYLPDGRSSRAGFRLVAYPV
jgi:formylglycine-generating enzyme required for sulfatase activity